MKYFDDLPDELRRRPGSELAVRTADYLMGCQVIADDAAVPMQPGATGGAPGDEYGELVTRELRGDGEPRRYTLVSRIDPTSGRRRLWIRRSGRHSAGPDDTAAGPFDVGDYFRLFRGTHLHHETTTRHEAEPHYTRRLVSKYLRLLGREIRSLGARRLRSMTVGVVQLVRYFIDRTRRLPRSHRFENVIGISWRLESLETGLARLSCYDRGGILDFHTNAEADPLPPQVMGTVYADAYASWVFAYLHLATGSPPAGDAAHQAIEFLVRVYPRYEVSMTPMTHADFKNAGLLETLRLYRSRLSPALGARLEALARTLRQDLYLPTNVYALRHHWKRAQMVGGFSRMTEGQLERLHARVRADLLPDGLIQDNNPGRFYFDSHDLTYHQYTLACLADSLRLRENAELLDTLRRGLRFSVACLTPDGEISYMGRGANNVYHLASAFSALRWAAARLEESDPAESALFARAAHLILPYLSRAQLPSGMLATAINPDVERRVAWNHCHSPYNALTAYLILRGAEERVSTRPDARVPMEKSGRLELREESGFAFCVTSAYYVTCFAGSERSYSWSAEHHFSGAPGLAMLGIPGAGAVTPILDGSLTDYPYAGDDPCGRGELRIDRAIVPSILFRREVQRRYLFFDTCVIVISRGRQPWLLRAPLRQDGEWEVRSVTRGESEWPGILSTDGHAGVLWTALFTNREWMKEERQEATTNPRGSAVLHQAGRIEARDDGETVTVCLIEPFVGRPTTPTVTVAWTEPNVIIHIGDQVFTETPDHVREAEPDEVRTVRRARSPVPPSPPTPTAPGPGWKLGDPRGAGSARSTPRGRTR